MKEAVEINLRFHMEILVSNIKIKPIYPFCVVTYLTSDGYNDHK